MLKEYVANLLWDGLKLFAGRLHDWVFDPRRAAACRMKNRERWWAYHVKACLTKDNRDDMRAAWFQIRFKFETPPEDAKRRGDLDAKAVYDSEQVAHGRD